MFGKRIGLTCLFDELYYGTTNGKLTDDADYDASERLGMYHVHGPTLEIIMHVELTSISSGSFG
ncbi:unnamed protein product [Protopolystoma xenopodis]|uniref:Uncharacterized protein n=1 Tax=Protopolystoma xenopodis TaxID=117903 RepID=A0A448X0D6_9PLAT|nr:unnamed protein product [Protopolystoma xenopodis]